MTSPESKPDSKIVICPHCAAANRVPAAKLGAGGKCGRCGSALFAGHPVELTAANFDAHAARSDLPLLVDADTGFGSSAFNVARTVKSMIKAGAAALHIEDQVGAKRCGHRPGKEIVSKEEMVDRIKAAVDARTDPNFVIMARTDALAVDGLEAALERAVACVEAGADMIFPEAITDLQMYTTFANAVKVPVLANITEFGATPLFTVDQLRGADVGLVLYPLSAFRAMNKAAENVYTALRRDGTQQNVLDTMQTRMELYESINYHDFEQKLDALFAAQKTK